MDKLAGCALKQVTSCTLVLPPVAPAKANLKEAGTAPWLAIISLSVNKGTYCPPL